MLPQGSKKTDWEVELGVVIGSRAQYVSEQDALKYVAGYTVVNDLSERSFQLSAARSGTRARAATPSARSVHGW
jgi:2-keto-4-pentenoate hydratase/2-oxohepta-3-ene-1,7-dioic acid hydratase in catechol pathway